MRGLVAAGQGQVPDLENLNSGKSFSWIEKWDAGDVAEWVWFAPQAGEGTITVWMSPKRNGGMFSMSMDNKSVSFSVNSQKEPGVAFTIQVTEPGLHRLQLVCEKAAAGTQFHWMALSGSCVKGAAILRKRWRPSAAYQVLEFSSKKPIRLWVMEMDAVPGELGFYAPITTPFWVLRSDVAGGRNCECWV